jgi:hypothetical protein
LLTISNLRRYNPAYGLFHNRVKEMMIKLTQFLALALCSLSLNSFGMLHGGQYVLLRAREDAAKKRICAQKRQNEDVQNQMITQPQQHNPLLQPNNLSYQMQRPVYNTF